MHSNNTILKNQRGVSLIITFFILTIILAIVLSISLLLYGEIKIVRNIGNSVVAFYAADSGVEKMLYYDRKRVPESGRRGLCYMFDSSNPAACLNDCTPNIDCVEPKCQGHSITGADCNILTCSDCQVSFNSFFDGKSYELKASVALSNEFPVVSIFSKGNYKDVSRKIQLQIRDESAITNPQAPKVTNGCFSDSSISDSDSEEEVELSISAQVTDPDGVASVVAQVQNPDGVDIGSAVALSAAEPDIYTGSWVGPDQDYFVDLEACDIKNNCSVVNNILNPCP